MSSRQSSLEKITALLNEIALEKQARDECDADDSSSVKKGKAVGATTKQDDETIARTYGPKQPTYSDSIAGGGLPKRNRSIYGTYTGQSSTDENPSRMVKNFDIDPSKYSRKRASALSDTELLQDIAVLGNNLLQEMLDQAQGRQTQEGHIAPLPISLEAERAVEKSAGNSVTTNQQLSEEEQISLATGVCVGLQKQAEYHADLVARYLYGSLATKLAAAEKTVNEDTSDTSEPDLEALSEEQEDRQQRRKRKEEEEEEEEEERAYKKKEDYEDEELEIKEETESESTKGDKDVEPPPIDLSGDESLSEEEAAKVLQDMAQTSQNDEADLNQQLTEEQLLNLIASVLPEMGGLEALQRAGAKGEKLASAVEKHIRSGNFKVPSLLNPRVKRASDFIKNYIYDLFNKNKRN